MGITNSSNGIYCVGIGDVYNLGGTKTQTCVICKLKKNYLNRSVQRLPPTIKPESGQPLMAIHFSGSSTINELIKF